MDRREGGKAPFVGDDRHRLVDMLVAAAEDVRLSGRSRCVVLRGALGSGKTRIVQEFYTELARGQSSPPYWPPQIDPNLVDDDPLKSYKRINPPDGDRPADAALEYLWWGVRCDGRHGEAYLRSLQSSAHLLHAHVEHILRRIEQRGRRRRTAASGLGEVVGMLMPDPFGLVKWGAESLPDLYRDFRSGLDSRRQRRQQPEVRQVDANYHGWEEPVEHLVGVLDRVLEDDLPLMLVVDDAHWADPGTVAVLDRILRSDLPVLVIAAAWPDLLRSQATEGSSQPKGRATFGAWLSSVLATLGNRTTLHDLDALSAEALRPVVDAVAPATEPAVIERLLELVDGSPLVLRLVLSTGFISSAIVDGAITVSVDELDRLPVEIQPLFAARWRDLPLLVRRAMSLGALQGREFSDSLVLGSAAAVDWAVDLSHVEAADMDHGWLEQPAPGLQRFVEEVQFEVARTAGRLSRELEQKALVGLVVHGDGLRKSESWNEIPEATRRRILDGVAFALDDSPLAENDQADVLIELSRVHASSGDWVEADRCVESTLARLGASTDSAGSDDARLWAVETRRKAGRVAESIALATTLLESWELRKAIADPQLAELRRQLGLALAGAGDLELAVAHLRLVVDARAEARPGSPEDVETVTDLAQVLMTWGRPEESLAATDSAVRRLAARGDDADPELQHALEKTTCEALVLAGEVDRAIDRERALLRWSMGRFGPADVRATDIAASLAMSLAITGRASEATRLLDDLKATLTTAEKPTRPVGRLLMAEGMALLFTGDEEGAQRRFASALGVFTDLGGVDDPEGLVAAWGQAVWRLVGTHGLDLPRFRDACNRVAAQTSDPATALLARQLDLTVTGVYVEENVDTDSLLDGWKRLDAQVNGGMMFSLAGMLTATALAAAEDWPQVLRLLDSQKIWRNAGLADPVLRVLQILARVSTGHGQQEDVEAAVRIALTTKVPLVRISLAPLLANLGLARGRPSAVVELVEELGLLAAEELGPSSLLAVNSKIATARLLAAAGDPGRAREVVSAAHGHMEGWDHDNRRASVSLELAWVYAVAGPHELAVELVEDVIASHELSAATPMGRKLLLRAARTLRRAGTVEAALDLNRRVSAGAQESMNVEERLDVAIGLANGLLAAGESEQAVPLVREVIAARRAGVGTPGELADALQLYAGTLRDAGDNQQALRAYEEALELALTWTVADASQVIAIRDALAKLLAAADRHDAAIPHLRVVADVERLRVGARHPSAVNAVTNLGIALGKVDPPAAVDLLEPLVAALKVEQAHPALITRARLALCDAQGHDHNHAIAVIKEGIDALVALPSDSPDEVQRLRENLGWRLFMVGEHEAAIAEYRRVHDAYLHSVGEADSSTVHAAGNLGANLVKSHRPEEALAVLEPAARAGRSRRESRQSLTLVLTWLASAYEALDRPGEAVAVLKEEIALRTALASREGGLEIEAPELSTARVNLGRVLLAMGQHQPAVDQLSAAFQSFLATPAPPFGELVNIGRKAVESLLKSSRAADALILLEPLRDDPRTAGSTTFRAAMSNWLALAYAAEHRTDEELAARRSEIEFWSNGPSESSGLLIRARLHLGRRLSALGRSAEALVEYRAALDVQRSIPDHVDPNAVSAATLLSQELSNAGEVDEAIEAKRTEVDLRERASGDRVDLVRARSALGRLLFTEGRYEEALSVNRDLLDQLLDQNEDDASSVVTTAGNVAASLVELGRAAEATAVLEPHIRQAQATGNGVDRLPVALSWLASAYRELDRPDDAIEARTEEIRLREQTPADVDGLGRARAALGILLFSGRRYEEAVAIEQVVLDELLAREDAEPASVLLAASNLAASMLKLGRPADSVAVLEPRVREAQAAEEGVERLPAALGWLASAYRELDRIEEAIGARTEEIRRRELSGSEPQPNAYEARLELGEMLFELQRTSQAIDVLRRLAENCVEALGPWDLQSRVANAIWLRCWARSKTPSGVLRVYDAVGPRRIRWLVVASALSTILVLVLRWSGRQSRSASA